MTVASDVEDVASGSTPMLEASVGEISIASAFRRRRGIWAGAIASSVALLAGVGLLIRLAMPRRSPGCAGRGLERVAGRGACGAMEDGTDYDLPELPYNVAQIKDAETCCSLCEQDPQCGAWTWGRSSEVFGLSGMCVLKALEPGAEVAKVPKPGVVSGLPAKSVRSSHKAEVGTATGGAHPRTSATSSQLSKALDPRRSLFCFTLMKPTGTEVRLMELQHKHHSGIFTCDESAIYSNETVRLAEGVCSKTIKSNLQASRGGDVGTPLNIDIFMALWWKVITDGQFMKYDWTVKVDPDAVFLPSRLRLVLGRYSDGPNGVYLNNCKLGLRGGLEVFSRKAVMSWAAGSARCLRHFERQCHGPCLWGEDRFIDQCLWKVLKVKRETVPSMLADADCDPPQNWMACTNTSLIAYHPFQDIGAYTECLFTSYS